MWQRSGSEIVPYQWLLRAIGTFLDREKAARIQIMETGEGFAVRYDCAVGPPEYRQREFGYEELLQFRTEMERARAARKRMDEPQGRYQDFLRALGHDLEEANAYFILLDEVDDDFLITYQYLRPSQSYLPHKHLSVINRDARQDLLQRAYSRRQVTGRKLSFSLLNRK